MKTKIFLGAYVNFPNAQNINCDHIAKHLDKDKFEVHVMYSSKMPIDKMAYKQAGIHLHKLIHRRYVWFWNKLLTMWLANCDIYYLPKLEKMDVLFAKAHKRSRRLFVSSIEGVVGKQIRTDDVSTRQAFDLMDVVFSISNCIQKSARDVWGKDTQVLHLGVDKLDIAGTPKDAIKNVIWSGSVIDRKRPKYLLEVAKRYPQLHFTMIGDGDRMAQIEAQIAREHIENVTLTGRIPNAQVYEHMQKNDLLLMTSEFEGLPKVIQEAAQCGLPSIYMAENYTVDFLEDGVNGYAVTSLEQMCERLSYLLVHPETYRAMSENARQIIQDYTWERLISRYEKYFLDMLMQKRKAVEKGEWA